MKPGSARITIIVFSLLLFLVPIIYDLLSESTSGGIGKHQWALIFIAVANLGFLLFPRIVSAVASVELIVVVTAVMAEVVITSVYLFTPLLDPPRSYVVHADPDSAGSAQLDLPGMRISSAPRRQARITGNTVEWIGTRKGNNWGYSDKDDFVMEKNPGTLRIAVFGDSFTDAQYLDISWPDKVEEIAGESDRNLELYNFAFNGAGLGNWWYSLRFDIHSRDWDFDAFVFAVASSDLYRDLEYDGKRYVWEDLRRIFDGRGYLAKMPIEEKPGAAWSVPSFYVDTKEFEAAISGNWSPPPETANKPLAPYLFNTLLAAYLYEPRELYASALDRGWLDVVEDVKRMVANKPVLVIQVPSYFDLGVGFYDLVMRGENYYKMKRYYLRTGLSSVFAAMLETRLIDGKRAFDGYDRKKIASELYFPYDRHWNQKASDIFATYFYKHIDQWLAETEK